MSGLKDTLKGGWHPKGKDGKSKESWRGDFKGIDQVAGWMGKKKSPGEEAEDHISRPLHTLKDPSAFGPPPKNVNYHGGAALPNQITPHTGGWGAPIPKEELEAKERAKREQAQREAEEAAKPKPPPVPYRANTTGLSTSHLPPPPGRKDGADGRTPVPDTAGKPKPPGLPPRLPPRQNSSTAPSPPPPPHSAVNEPDAHKGILNQGSLNRLGAAGVSVPGFGIGASKGKPILPPPNTASPSRSPAPTASPVQTSQLNELQSRFSRLSSSTTPKPEAPSEGTTWAQKQAALKTASSFRDDPSKVSFNDARAAASTANNFRERHGEQVKSGWQSANKLNNKYGITDKVGAYGGVSSPHNSEPPEQKSLGIEMRDNTNGNVSAAVVGKKKPPPPPVKRVDLTGGSSSSPEPPPIPLASKPKPGPQPTSSHEQPYVPQDLDLDLQSLWFAQTPTRFPPKTIKPSTITYAATSGWSSSGVRKTHTYSAHIRFYKDLSSTKIHLTWDSSNPGITVKVQQRHCPPPKQLSRGELEDYRRQYSDSLASWCESQMGQQVGDGECWTLAHHGLEAIGAMPSQTLIHGALVYSCLPAQSNPQPQGSVRDAGVARGDVIQILKAHFQLKNGGSAWAGDPDHTAVITEVEPNGVLKVVEQNVGGVKRVRTGSYDMSTMVTGELRIYRGVSESWVGKLDPNW
ncbi:related to myosin tail region-interacting protein MTI1 [Phialocephala subalpina]|uniref:Related to myosin tail region-interacting protein MTI1 n=1 Tax=Phialocephala subalpina TaxID=576137 RepID=A0A1L7WNY6_9HELO|nr:related to myosin tail region-interacting protein MTI1 [Phialocephala subalpina]